MKDELREAFADILPLRRGTNRNLSFCIPHISFRIFKGKKEVGGYAAAYGKAR